MNISTINDWKIDTSAGAPILTYKNCSVIESEQAEYVLSLIKNAEQPGVTVREAQPLGFTHSSEISNMQATGLYLRAWPVDRRQNEQEGYTIPLFTAPPAPAVPDDITGIIKRFQHQCDHLSDWHHIDEHSCKVDRRDLMTVTAFLNACRAAMLQPVSQGYTLPDGYKLVPVEPTPEMIAATEIDGDEYYFESDEAAETWMANKFKALLAAAPTPTNVTPGENIKGTLTSVITAMFDDSNVEFYSSAWEFKDSSGHEWLKKINAILEVPITTKAGE